MSEANKFCGRNGWWSWISITVLTVVLYISFVVTPVQSEEDRIYFESNGSDKETHFLFEGEEMLDAVLIFGENCTRWGIDITTDLFGPNFFLHETHNESVKAGTSIELEFILNEDIPFGNYNTTIRFNYTTEDDEEITKTFYYIIHYVKVLEITKVRIPETWDENFVVEVEIFLNISKLKVGFDSDGNIKITNKSLNYSNLSPGKYFFKTPIYMSESFPGDEQELGYRITATIEENQTNRSIVFSEYNMKVSVGKAEDSEKPIFDNWGAILIGVAVVALIVFNYFYYFRGREQ